MIEMSVRVVDDSARVRRRDSSVCVVPQLVRLVGADRVAGMTWAAGWAAWWCRCVSSTAKLLSCGE